MNHIVCDHLVVHVLFKVFVFCVFFSRWQVPYWTVSLYCIT